MEFKIRKAISTDYIEVCKLVCEVHKLHLKNRPDVYLKVDNPFEKKQFEEALDSSTTKIFVVENCENKEIVAYSIIQIMNIQNPICVQKKFIYIDDFCVKSTFKRNGIGRKLFKYIGEYAKSKEASSLQLNVWEFNQEAIDFYNSMGMSTRNRRMEFDI